MRNKKILFSTFLVGIIAIIIIAKNNFVQAVDEKTILLPAYGNPCCGDGATMWSDLIDTAEEAEDYDLPLHINVIFNPASGPGTSTDPNYYNPTNPTVGHKLAILKDAGGDHVTIYGYVDTNYGARSSGDVEDDIDAYQDLYPDLVDGIFFDRMSNQSNKVSYHHDLYDYVKNDTPTSSYKGGPVIGNPGTQTIEDYLESSTQGADTLVIFENTGYEYENNYSAPAWVEEYSSDHFAHLVHGQSTWDDDFWTTADDRNAGMLYVTDDEMWNPWDALATYWDDEVETE